MMHIKEKRVKGTAKRPELNTRGKVGRISGENMPWKIRKHAGGQQHLSMTRTDLLKSDRSDHT